MNSQHASYRSLSPNPLPRAAHLAALFMVLIWQPVAADENSIVGTWLTGDGDGWVDVVRAGDGISGTIYDPNKSSRLHRHTDAGPNGNLDAQENLKL